MEHETLALSPDGSRLATCSRGDGAIVFDTHTGERVWSCQGQQASGVSWSPDSRYLACGETDQSSGQLTLLDTLPP
eukprot:CAMPEP_0206257412 /NCGR_PEP_ID=MMETSP0047_2-20121206/25326_1 /ASSEMBLY_ACC=CAM_ASM_000192 /TAXON_ID=195065 /ORGANISM="Chroomonas mesostigmatica_cf, Strain CCMP1168" /LENGTH=75 /DNA_ID=CAMNT_0053683995 /DNA_START=209 /DNA_END=432 /DNA_ORIENTATION=+